jgi:hypothetical protein
LGHFFIYRLAIALRVAEKLARWPIAEDWHRTLGQSAGKFQKKLMGALFSVYGLPGSLSLAIRDFTFSFGACLKCLAIACLGIATA